MIVGNRNARPIAGQLAPRPAVHVPLPQIVENRRLQRRSLHAIAAAALVKLIADERQQVGIQLGHVGRIAAVGKRLVRVARDIGHGQHRLIDRIAADQFLPRYARVDAPPRDSSS